MGRFENWREWLGARIAGRADFTSTAPQPPAAGLPEPMRTALESGHLRPSFSQLGEDATLAWLFSDQRAGFYVDVGCHHPYRYSNTAALHLFQGWSGINIDLDRRAIAAFDAARPADVNVVSGVGSEAGRREAVLFTHSAEMNSLDPGFAAQFGGLEHTRELVDVLPLATLLDRHMPPGRAIDFLNVDAEGFDLDVLRSNDWERFRPKAVAVEVQGWDATTLLANQTHAFMSERGYRLLSHTVVTSIYQLTG